MFAVDGMRAEQQIVEGEVEERERFGAQRFEGRIRGRRGGVELDDGVQKILLRKVLIIRDF
jgi:hypothetical protein